MKGIKLEADPASVALFKAEMERDGHFDSLCVLVPAMRKMAALADQRNAGLRKALFKLASVADNPGLAAAPGFHAEVIRLIDEIADKDGQR